MYMYLFTRDSRNDFGLLPSLKEILLLKTAIPTSIFTVFEGPPLVLLEFIYHVFKFPHKLPNTK